MIARDINYKNFIVKVQQITDTTFNKEVIESNQLVLVDFWADWCGPCKMVSPVIDEIAHEYNNIIKVVKVNTDENPSTAASYGIRSIPTLLIFNGGHIVDTVIGAVPKSTVVNRIQECLKGS